MEKQPCPYRIYDDLGTGYALGGVVGSIWHFGKGARNAPRGERIAGAIRTLKAKGPVLGGNFAMWSGLFSSFECCFLYYRGKEDFINSVASGALTGGALALRGGWKAVMRSSMFGGIFLGLIEGVNVFVSRMMMQQQQGTVEQGEVLDPPQFGYPKYNVKDVDTEFEIMPSKHERTTSVSQSTIM